MNIELTGINIVFVIITLIISIGVHEALHGFAAFWLGDDTAAREGRLSLNPLRHIDPVLTILMPLLLFITIGVPLLAAKPVPFNPMRVKYDEFGAALVALAGPLSNLLMAMVAAIPLRFMGLDGGTFTDALLIFLQINVGLFVFNMIPIPPLDGSRVLYAVAPGPIQRVMEQIEQLGMIMILVFFAFLIPVLGPFIVDANQAVLQFLL